MREVIRVEPFEEKKYYTAKEVREILGITYSALRNHVHAGRIRSTIPPGKRQAVYLREDVAQLQQSEEEKTYYAAKEAQKILGMTYSALRNQVDAGNIRSIVPPGKRQAVYLREDVAQLAREMEAFFVAKQAAPSVFKKATEEDMPESVALSAAIFGGVNIIPLERRIAWLKRNPDIDYILRHDSEMVGYASIVPLRPETLAPLLRDELLAKDITPDEIEEFKPGKPLQLYIMAMGIKPRLSKLEKRTYASRLLKGMRDVIIEMGKRGVVIDTIIARSEVPDGINILRHYGFTEVPSEVPGTRNFIIEIEKSGIPALMEYKRELAAWKERSKK
jgi:hypothetical protein